MTTGGRSLRHSARRANCTCAIATFSRMQERDLGTLSLLLLRNFRKAGCDYCVFFVFWCNRSCPGLCEEQAAALNSVDFCSGLKCHFYVNGCHKTKAYIHTYIHTKLHKRHKVSELTSRLHHEFARHKNISHGTPLGKGTIKSKKDIKIFIPRNVLYFLSSSSQEREEEFPHLLVFQIPSLKFAHA